MSIHMTSTLSIDWLILTFLNLCLPECFFLSLQKSFPPGFAAGCKYFVFVVKIV